MKKISELVLSDYPFKTFDKVRYRDTDRQGHVNNAVFAQFLETGRVEILYNSKNELLSSNCSFVIAKVNTSLISEINWPGIVDIGTGITKIGNSSINIIQSLYQNNKLVATSETVIVQMDELTRKSSPLTQKAKQYLSSLLIEIEVEQ